VSTFLSVVKNRTILYDST